MKKEKSFTVLDYLKIIIKWRKVVLLNVVIVTCVAVIISLILIPQYTATATILPPSEDNLMFGFMTAGVTSGLAGLARMGASIPGLSTPSDLFAAIMRSGRVKSSIIRKYDLKKEFRAKTMHDASKALSNITKIEVTPEGIISVSVTYRNKYLATDIANSYIEELDKFNTQTAMTTGKKYRIFVEERLKETEDTLTAAEEKFRAFQEEHHTIALDTEVEKAIETIAEFKSQIILLEVKKGALTSSSQTGNPYLYNIDRELRELKKQLFKIEFGGEEKNTNAFGAGFAVPFSRLPEVSLEYVRLLRDVKVQGTVYELLIQQYEQAKIMEMKDTPTVQMLDGASPPERRSFPERKKIVAIAFIISLFIGIGNAYALEYIKKISQRNEGDEWRYIGKTLKEDIEKIKFRIRRILKRQ